MTCATCKFSNSFPADDDSTAWECRRYPPQICTEVFTGKNGRIGSKLHSWFPRTDPKAVCGEYASKLLTP